MCYLFDVILVGDVLDLALARGLNAEFEAGCTHVFVKSNSKSMAAGTCCTLGEIFYICCLETLR